MQLIIAYFLCASGDLFADGSSSRTALQAVALGKLLNPFMGNLLRGIGCNTLVCLAVYSAHGANDMAGKILAIWFPITAFLMCGCVARQSLRTVCQRLA